MVERDNVFSLQDYLAVLRRQKGLVVLVAVLATVAGVVWFFLQTPQYQARAELTLERVRTAQDISLNELLNPTGTVGQAQVTAATSLDVAERAAQQLGRDDPEALRSKVSATADAELPILRITATDPDPATASAVADAFATAFVEYRRDEAIEAVLTTQQELEDRAADLRREVAEIDAEIESLGGAAEPTFETDPETGAQVEVPGPELSPEAAAQVEILTIRRQALQSQLSQVIARSTELGESADALTGFTAGFTAAQVPTTPVGSDLVTVAMVSFILGLALGIGLAFARDHFDDVIRDEADFKRASGGRPVLGRIPMWKPHDGDIDRVASLKEPTSSAAEAYRELSAGVRFLLVARDDEPEHDAAEHHGLSRSRVVMVSSASMSEGKTATAANLAVAAARVGLRTVLIDADLRRPAIAKRFGLGRTTGLSDALLNGEPPESHAVDVGVDDLLVLPAGTIPPNPAELLASPAMRALQQNLLRKYDLVVIDTPAVLAVPDALEIGPYVDLAIMVGRVGQTSRRRLGAAIERLDQVGTDVSGTVLNSIDPSADGYYYAYYYQEAEDAPTGRKGRAAAKRSGGKPTRSSRHGSQSERRGGPRPSRSPVSPSAERPDLPVTATSSPTSDVVGASDPGAALAGPTEPGAPFVAEASISDAGAQSASEEALTTAGEAAVRADDPSVVDEPTPVPQPAPRPVMPRPTLSPPGSPATPPPAMSSGRSSGTGSVPTADAGGGDDIPAPPRPIPAVRIAPFLERPASSPATPPVSRADRPDGDDPEPGGDAAWLFRNR
jgi:polysaccharide biosynthesis transport protein